MLEHLPHVLGLAYATVHILSLAAAVHAVMEARTAQGATAWAIALVAAPIIALPLYLVFGRGKFRGYVDARRSDDRRIQHIFQHLTETYRADDQVLARAGDDPTRALEQLAGMPFTRGNHVELLIDGKATFDAIFAGIREALDYVLVQFYIVRDDRLGRRLKDLLLTKARAGVRVYFLYDEVGSYQLSEGYLDGLKVGGVKARPFHSTRGRANRFQINFRNHRKIVVVDGLRAYVGGHNVGDEYLGLHPTLTPWRDTHCAVEGPAVHELQISFLTDWHWATGEVPDLDWTLRRSPRGDVKVLALPSGPADKLETCNLFFTHAIHSARERVWIVSPYFVPDEAVGRALQLAALRGADVRVMLPGMADHRLVYLAAFAYFDELKDAGVKFYRLRPGFLHQKVLLVDDTLGAVGTANLDNRSFRLNFEITLVCADQEFAKAVAAMLADDFSHCRPVRAEARHPFYFRAATRIARLFAPVL